MEPVKGLENALAIRKQVHDRKRFEEACQEVESIFLYQLIQTMRRSMVAEENKKSYGSGIYESIIDLNLSKELAKRGALGIKELLLKQLGKNLERASKESVEGADKRLRAHQTFLEE